MAEAKRRLCRGRGPRSAPNYARPIEILFVCTGNICRSPMAEALLRARLADLGVPEVSVSSAGLLFDGRPAEPGAIDALHRRGLDGRDHHARRIDADLLAETDLVIAMEHRHVREAVVAGARFDRTFTLPELVQRAASVGPRQDEPIDRWLDLLAHDRSPGGALRADPELEVSDPMGGSRRRFRRCADELADLVDRFVALAWPVEATLERPPIVESWSNP